MMDVGGGLGIDYDGSQTDFESSVNYTLQEYANDVVFRIKSVCDEVGCPASDHHLRIGPGRGGLSQSAGVRRAGNLQLRPLPGPRRSSHRCSAAYLRPVFHSSRSEQEELSGRLPRFPASDGRDAQSLQLRLSADRIACPGRTALLGGRRANCNGSSANSTMYRKSCTTWTILLSDTYFCNFSVFQSMPDSWAIKQLFPIMPIHRLNEAPTRRAVLGDITCDSDGKIDQFIDLRDVRNTLELHPFNGEPYYLGAFLIGAYQEILGDLHNLLGDTNAVHVNIEEDGTYTIDDFIPGDTVREVLHYVQFSAEKLIERMRKDVEKALRYNKISMKESREFLRFYESGMEGYTYLEE